MTHCLMFSSSANTKSESLRSLRRVEVILEAMRATFWFKSAAIDLHCSVVMHSGSYSSPTSFSHFCTDAVSSLNVNTEFLKIPLVIFNPFTFYAYTNLSSSLGPYNLEILLLRCNFILRKFLAETFGVDVCLG